MIILSLYFRFISKYWLGFQIYAIIAMTACFLGSCLAPESPKYLYSYQRFKEAKQSLQFIARFNRVDAAKRNMKYIFDTEVPNRKETAIISQSSTWNPLD